MVTAPTISAPPIHGLEDQPIVLNIGLTAQTDSSIGTIVTITGLPIDATLSAGIHNNDGSWSLTPGQLAGLTLTLPAHDASSFDLTVTAASSANGVTASTTADLPITIDSVAFAPALSATAAIGLENTSIPLHIDAALAEIDANGMLSVTVSGLPAGATLSAGTHNNDGSWTLTIDQLTGLTMTAPTNFSGTIATSVTATASENGTTASVTTGLNVTVEPVAFAPILTVAAAIGNEGSPIALAVGAALAVPDQAGTLSITIAGLPAGATLSAGTHNADGSYTLTTAQLTGLTLMPPAHYTGTLTLTLTATSSENGTSVGTTATLPVTVEEVATVPALTVQAATGLENGSVALQIGAAATGADSAEIVSLTLAGVPAGATLSAGLHNSDGSWTLTVDQLPGLTLTPPANWSGTLGLTVTATASEHGTTASAIAALPVTINPVATPPSLVVSTAAGVEDAPIPLQIAAGLAGGDSGEALSITVAGLPAGATLSAGVHNADGSYTLTAGQLAGLTLTPPPHFNGALDLSVTAVTMENGTSASLTAALPVAIAAIALTPNLAVQAAIGLEDTALPLPIAASLLTPDNGETLSVTIAGLPTGATLSAGIHNADGSYTLTAAQLTGLTLTPPAHWSGSFDLSATATAAENGTTATIATTLPVSITGVATAPVLSLVPAIGVEDAPVALAIQATALDTGNPETLAVTISGLPAGATLSAGTHNADGSYTLTTAQLTGLALTPPAQWSGNFALTVTATAGVDGTSASTAIALPVTVTGIALPPVLTVLPAAGSEDAPVALNISAGLINNDAGEALSVTVANLPAGATLSAGIHNADGSYTLTAGQLTGLTLTPPAHWSGAFDLSVTATAVENGATAVTSGTLPVVLAGVAVAPSLALLPATGVEDGNIALHIATGRSDIDTTETLSVTVTGLPAGATLSAGMHNADGSYTLTAAQLTGLTLTPPAQWSGNFALDVTVATAVNGTSAMISGTLPVAVAGIAEAPMLLTAPAIGIENSPVALAIGAVLGDIDPAESLSVTVSGLPAGATLSAGTHNADGSYTLTTAQLTGLTLAPPANWNGDIPLAVTAATNANGTSASVTAALPVHVAGIALAPILGIQATIGHEDSAIALPITAALATIDPNETLAVTVSGLPAGATLSAGVHNADGSYTLNSAQLTGLSITPPAHYTGTLTLAVTATTTENGTTASVMGTLPVLVEAVAQAPVLTLPTASGLENGTIPLTIAAGLAADDANGSLSVTIAGLPTGATLSAGVHNADGSYTLTAGQLTGLTLTPPQNLSGPLTLAVTATTTENGTVASTTGQLGVTVEGIAFAPLLHTVPAIGSEDTPVPLAITAALGNSDPSETLLVTVGGLPAGATLSAGTHNADGSYTLTAGQLTGLTLTPPSHFHGALNLTVTATASDNGTTASTVTSLPITVTGVAATPVLTALAATGIENTPVALTIGAALPYADADETLRVTVANIPAGATLSAGTHNADGSYTLTTAQLSGLTITPPTNWNGNFNLAVTATGTENGTASISVPLPVVIAGMALTPSLSVAAAAGVQDHAIALPISAALATVDPNETLAVTITGIPAGATLSTGTHNADGSYTLTQAQLTGLTITPPAHWSGSFALGVAATATENGASAGTALTLPVTVAGMASAPVLSALAAAGTEDVPVALNIAAAGIDLGGSETVGVTITGIPTGATLSAGTHNADGSYTLTQAQLTGLTLTPPAHWSGNFTLGVTATAAENGTAATSAVTLPVAIAGVANAPVLTLQAVTGIEGAAVALPITAAGIDLGGSETVGVTIAGLPAGATLSAGTHNADGSYTLTAAQLTGLTLTPPAQFHGALALSVTTTASENGTTASTTGSLPIAIIGVAATPVLTALAATGVENAPVALAIGASLPYADADESLSVTIAGLPIGATLSAGTHNADGSYTLTPVQLSGLTITPPANWHGSFNLAVTATGMENGTASVSTTVPVAISGIALTPALSVAAAAGVQDHAITLPISAALAVPDANENLAITVMGVPTGATLSAGIHNADGSYTLTQAQLAGLTITPPAHWSGSFNLGVTATTSENGTTATAALALPVTVAGVASAPVLTLQAVTGIENTAVALPITAAGLDLGGSETVGVTIAGLPAGATLSAGTHNADGSYTLTAAQLTGLTLTPPAHFHGALTLSVTATASENGTSASTSATLPIAITGIAATPVLTAIAATGVENAPVALAIGTSLPYADADETVSVTIAGLPIGATLSAGTHNADGSYTLAPAQLTGLTITPPANWNGSFNLAVTATGTENGTASVSTTVPVVISGIALTPTLTVAAAAGVQDHAIALPISAALLVPDANESLAVTITGVPTGATLSAGTHNADGSYTLSAAQLTSLTITPPAHWSGSFSLGITAVTSENGTTATTSLALPVTVAGVASAPVVAAVAAVGTEDMPVALHITAAGIDLGTPETVAVIITGVPTGATLSAGTHNADGSYTLTPAQLTGLTMTPPVHWSGSFSLGIAATAMDNGTTATTHVTLPVSVAGVATAPLLSVQAGAGVENAPIALTIGATPVDVGGVETVAVTITGLPTGATLSAGTHNADGSYTLTAAQLTGLTLTPPLNYNGTLTLGVTATASENGTTATTSSSLPVVVAGIALPPVLTVPAAAGAQDTAVHLTIGAALSVADANETLSVIIGNIPAGATLSAGTHNADGTYTLTAAQLTNLTITPPVHWSGSLNLAVTATTTENGTTASTSASLPVTIAGVATAPALVVTAAAGTENGTIPLTVTAAGIDLGTPETVAITISGLPSGATLSAGTHNANGSYTLTPAQLIGLSLTPPANWAGSLTLAVAATATENGTTATSSASLPVTVAGVAVAPTLASVAAIGVQDVAVPLMLSAGLSDTDASETLKVTVAGIPTGATLSAGTHNADGSYTLTAGQLTGLTLTPPAHWSGSFTLAVTAATSVNGTSASTASSVPVTITGVATAPALVVQTAIGRADSAIPITITAAGVDLGGSETVGVTITGVPAGATLSAGIHNADGSYTLTAAQLTGLTLTPPLHWNGALALGVTATATENGTTASTTTSLPVTVTGIAITPAITMYGAIGNEDSAIPLSIAAALTNVDASETLAVTISGLPTGATLSAGTHNADGSYTVTTAQLTGLTLTPPLHYSGSLGLTVTATSAENGTTASLIGTLPVTVQPTASVPALATTAAAGLENAPIPLIISSAMTSTDGTEALSILIGGVPTGATLSAGTNNGNGTYSLTPAQLSGLTITPHGASGTIALTVTAIATETDGNQATTSAPLAVTVAAAATAPTLTVSAATGLENTAIPLNVAAALVDIDASESLSITVSGLPTGATLSAGTHNANGSYTLTAAQLTGLTLTPPTNSDTGFSLTVTATAVNGAATAVHTATLPVAIAGVATAPTITASASSVAVNTVAAVTLAGALTNTDGTESLTYTIGGVPDGFALNHGTNNGNNVWLLSATDLAGLSLTSPYNFQGTLHLTATAVAHETEARSPAVPRPVSL